MDSAEREGLRPKGNVPNLRFPEFQGEWEKTKIGDIAIVVGGGTPDTNTSQYWNGKIQWFTPSEIGRNKYVYNSVRTISEEGLNKSSAKLLPIGTILLSSRATVGECSINKKECTTNQGFQSLIPKENISNEFVYYLIQTKRKDLIRKSCGSTFLEISANEVRKIVVSRPTIKERDKRAKLWSLLDERIATQNRIIDKLQSLIKGICNNYFEKLSVQEKANLIRLSDVLKERNEYSSKDGKFIHGTLSKDGIFPKTGRWDRDFLVKQEDKKYKVTHLDDICYNPANLKFGVICRNTFGDLIFSPIYVTFEVCKNVNIGFMELYLTNHNFIEKVRRFEQGTVYERMAVSPEDFLSYKIRIPSYSDQTFFYKKVQWLITLSQNEMKLLSQYKKLRQYLLRQMFI